MTVKLDTRPARPLTSREAASVICAAIGPALVRGKRAEVASILSTFADPATAPAPAEPRASLEVAHSLLGPDLGWTAIVGAVIGGLQRSSPSSTTTAVRWALDHLDEMIAAMADPAATASA